MIIKDTLQADQKQQVVAWMQHHGPACTASKQYSCVWKNVINVYDITKLSSYL